MRIYENGNYYVEALPWREGEEFLLFDNASPQRAVARLYAKPEDEDVGIEKAIYFSNMDTYSSENFRQGFMNLLFVIACSHYRDKGYQTATSITMSHASKCLFEKFGGKRVPNFQDLYRFEFEEVLNAFYPFYEGYSMDAKL